MLCRAPNETHIDVSGEQTSRPYEGAINDDNPDGDLNLAHLLHLVDLIRAHPNRVAYTEKQLTQAYASKGVLLCRLTLSL